MAKKKKNSNVITLREWNDQHSITVGEALNIRNRDALDTQEYQNRQKQRTWSRNNTKLWQGMARHEQNTPGSGGAAPNTYEFKMRYDSAKDKNQFLQSYYKEQEDKQRAQERQAQLEQSRKNTKIWQGMARDEQHSGLSGGAAPNTYELKMRYDSAKNKQKALDDYYKELEEKRNKQIEEQKEISRERSAENRKLTQDATYLFGNQGDPGLAYRAVMQGADPEATRKIMNDAALEYQENQQNVQREYDNYLNSILKAQGDTSEINYGKWLGGMTPDVSNALKMSTAQQRLKKREEDREKGLGNYGKDYSTYNNEGLNEALAYWTNEKDNAATNIDKLAERQKKINSWQPDYSGWGNMFNDYGLDEYMFENDVNLNAKKIRDDIEQGYELPKTKVRKGRGFEEEYDVRNIFDSIYGDGEGYYDEITSGMTEAEKEVFDSKILNSIGGMIQGENADDLNGDIATWQSKQRYAEEQINKIISQQKVNEDYGVHMWKYGAEGDTYYHADNDTYQPLDFQEGSTGSREGWVAKQEKQAPSVDTIYSFINRGKAYENWISYMDEVPSGFSNVAMMLPDEIDVFNKYYNAGKKDEAMAFVNGLQTVLNQRYSYYGDIKLKDMATRYPVLSSAATFLATAAQPFEFIANIAGKIFGDDLVNDPDSPYHALTNYKNKTRQFVGEELGEVGQFLYNAGMSAGDSFLNVMTGNMMGLTGSQLQAATLMLFGTQTFQTSMEENLRETNGNWGYSFVESTIDALIETATEIWSVENLLSDPSNFLKYIFKTSFSEASEEFVGSAFGPLVKEMLGRKNEWKQRADYILADGGYTDDQGNWVPVDSGEEATRQAMKEWTHDVIISTLSGAVSTGGGIFVGGVKQAESKLFGENREAGKAIRAAETGATSGQDLLIEAALNMGQDSKSYQQAQKIQQKMDAAKKVSDYEIGKLANNIYKESGKMAANAAQTVVEDKAYEKLNGAGMEQNERREMAKIMAEAVTKGGVDNLTKEQKHKLLTNEKAFNVYKDFMFESETSRETMGAIMDATQKNWETQASVSELLDKRTAQAVKDSADPGEQMADEEDIRQASGEAVTGSRGVIVNGQWGKLGNLITVNETAEDGKTKKALKWKVTVNGEEKTVDASEIRAADYSTAAIIRQATINPGMFSNGFTNQLMLQNETGEIKNVGRYLIDAQRVRLAAYLGQQMPANTLGSKAAQTLYDFSKEEHAMNRANQVKGRNAGGNGKINFLGTEYEYNSKEWNQAIKSISNQNQRNQIDAIVNIGKAAGINVTFKTADEFAKGMKIEDSEKKMYYGLENNEGITINIDGLDYVRGEDGKPAATGSHHMLVTFGHEMTHWLQRNSMQGYNRLESFVFSEMRKNGKNVSARVMEVMDNLDLSIEDAMSEIVADSCDQILANEEVAKHIEETDQKLYKEIRGFVKNLVSRVRNAIKGMNLSMSRDARAMLNSTNQLAEIWLGAYDEAISGAIRYAEGNGTEEGTKFSRLTFSEAQKEYDGKDFSKDGSIYNYDFMVSMPDIEVVHMPKNIGHIITTKGRLDHTGLIKEGKKNAAQYGNVIGNETFVTNDYTGRNLRITNRGINHGTTTGTASRIFSNARAGLQIGLLAKNAVPINGLTNESKDAIGTYAMAAPIVTDQGQNGIAILTIETRSGDIVGIDTYDQLHAISTRKMNGVSQGTGNGSVLLSTNLQAGPTSFTRSTKISIADLLDVVNSTHRSILSQDVLDHYGEQRPANGYWTPRVLFSKAQLDNEYKAAVESGDLARAEEMLLEKLQRTEGITAFNAPEWYAGQHKDIAQMIKDGTPEVIARAAGEMAQYVPDNAVLIPMPPHEGTVTDDTDTMILAKAIGELTGRPVVNALASNERESRYKAKAENRKGITAEEMGFRQIAEIPDGTMPIFIDNVVGSGETAKAARIALGGGITLSYAKSVRSKGIEGLKRATVTYDNNGKLIPLSKRFDINKRDTRYSKAQLDQAYDQALKSGDMTRLQELVDKAAKNAGYTIRAYHGSNAVFTKFKGGNRGEMWFGSTPETAYERNYMYDTYLKMNNPYEVTYYVGVDSEFNPSIVTEEGRHNGHDGGIVHFKLDPEKVEQTLQILTKFAETLPVTDSFGDSIMFLPRGKDRANLAKPGETLIEFMKRGAKENLYDWYVVYNPDQIKSADPITYDDQGKPIKLSERFNPEDRERTDPKNDDIRWSRAQANLTEEQKQKIVDDAEAEGIDLNMDNHTATMFSRASFERSEYYKNPKEMAKMLARNVLGSESESNIKKATKWIKDVTSIAAIIGKNKSILDYIASPGRSSFKSNPEYGGSIDSSTICAKRRLQTGTLDAIQAALPDYVMTAEDFLQVRRMMKKKGYEVSCGLCFVESSRKNIAKYASQFMREWNAEHPDNQVNMTQINTVLGLEETRLKNEEVYKAYEKFMNKLAQRKPKLFEMRSEYDNDILKHFRNDTSVEEKNRRGGMRINSFSDFEIVHLIDMMQVIMDMSNVGLAGQAYTKVREFAEALGGTGLKINMSMIAGGVDENGKIIFDEVEGMKWKDVEDLRNKYADDVGTVCVVFTEEELMAAMADDRIDFIIPFHRSQWNKSNYKDIGLPDNVKDFTYWQNERYRTPVYGTKKDGSPKKMRATNYMPNDYWDFSKSGKENAELYLKKCFEENKIPKFWKWLQSNGDGSFSLKEDGSTDGYWKLLIDFKMYNHITGIGAEQKAVHPDFDMKASKRMLKEYKGGHEKFPVAQDIVDEFVAEKKKGRKGIESKGGKIQLAGNEIESRLSRGTPESMDVGLWMSGQTPGSLQTEDERALLQAYRDMRISISLSIRRQEDYKAQIRRMEQNEEKLTPQERDDLQALRIKLRTQEEKQAELENKLYEVTASDGYAGMMYRNNKILQDFVQGKTADQVRESVEQMIDQVGMADKAIARQVAALRKLADSQAVKAVKANIDRKSLNYAVNSLKKELNSSMGKEELESRLVEIALRMKAGEDVTEDARALVTDMSNRMRGFQNDVLERMRGLTITIGPEQLAELKGMGWTMSSVRQALKGTGIRVKTGDFSSLDNDAEEIRALLPEMPAGIGENSASDIIPFIEWAQKQVELDKAQKEQLVDIDDSTISAIALASQIKIGEESEESRKQNEAAIRTRQAADELEQAGRQLKTGLTDAGTRAVSWASVLQRDVHDAIRYYNQIAKIAAQEEKQKVRKDVIEKLRSESTRKLIEQEEKYKAMMKADRKARETAEDNKIIRNRITTVAKRMRTRLLEETDQKNIPEAAKPLARKLLELLVNHDYVGYRHVLYYSSKEQMEKTARALVSLRNRDGDFDIKKDLNWLIVGTGEDADTEMADRAMQDLMNIETGLLEYRNAEGQGRISVMDRNAALKKIQDATAEIWAMISARSNAEMNHKRMLVQEIAQMAQDDMKRSRFKGEWQGRIGHGIRRGKQFVVYGNMTPEYFFKSLRNGTLSQLYDEYHRAENRNGLEIGRAQVRLGEIAEKYGYKTWDPEKRYTFTLEKGGDVSLTLGEMMSLYATWEREQYNQTETNGPEESYHLKVGGFYTQQEEQHKILGREIVKQKAHKLTESDMDAIMAQMTPEQISYVNDIVQYMTKEIGALGNEASMRMFGIKKYNEKWYFPFEVWEGVKSKKSDAGAAGNVENRAANFSGSKRRVNNASNALVIRDFTQVAAKHIIQMINYNTFAPAIEFMNRALNEQLVNVTQVQEGELDKRKLVSVVPEGETKRNLRAAFAEAYGKDALDYLDNFMKDMNGGVTRVNQTAADKLLSVFKKSAVAGSLSVAMQQPMSYIRAANMVSPKYLIAALNPKEWKGSLAEMEKYSGVAVIKRMGKFDINLGRSAQEYITPEGYTKKGKAAYEKISDISTALPELMDRATWTRMWTACKLEQQALHPDMDHKSDEFMELVAERFNDIMRKTQVYDSVLVKSQNMRSQHFWMKGITSFMAEPTLTLNVLADAVANVKEKGGKETLAKACLTFIMSAIGQALVKGAIGAKRNPKEEKTYAENVLHRFTYSLISEADPFNLIPGISNLVEILKGGEVSDNALGVLSDLVKAVVIETPKLFDGKGDFWKEAESTIGLMLQMFTNIPFRNVSRDIRAYTNWLLINPYAKRETSAAVLKNQTADQFWTADNMFGVLNSWLNIYPTSNSAYYQRIYDAEKAGDRAKAAEYTEYLKLAKNVEEKTISEEMAKRIKADEELTAEEKADKLIDNGTSSADSYVIKGVKDGSIDRNKALNLLKKDKPEADENSLWWRVDRAIYEKETGKDIGSSETYYRFKDAMESGKSDEISAAVKQLLEHGVTKDKIIKKVGDWKQAYLNADDKGKVRIRNAIQIAYKAMGLTEKEANKKIDGWKPAKKKK